MANIKEVFKRDLTPIQKFIKAKEENHPILQDEDNWKDFPIEFTDEDNTIRKGFIQDAVALRFHREGNRFDFRLEVVIMVPVDHETKQDAMQAYRIHKICSGPEGCQINWDIVHCAYEVNRL